LQQKLKAQWAGRVSSIMHYFCRNSTIYNDILKGIVFVPATLN
jgi:hypothetical protein